MSTLQEIISKPLFETVGSGKAIYEDGFEVDTNFTLHVLSNGSVIGELELPTTEYSQIFTRMNKGNFFILKGKTSHNNEKITMEKAYLTGTNTKFGTESSLKGRFSAFNVTINPDSLKSSTNLELVIQFGLINVYQTFRVIVDTKLGELQLAHHDKIEELERLMQYHKLPLITSSAELFVKPDSSQLLGDIVDKAIETVQNFLKITSLAQTTKHNWVYMQVYEKTNESDNMKLIFLKIHPSIVKSPISRGITNPAHSDYFIRSAWNGYSSTLNEEYGFDLALEWYLESNATSNIESKFLDATTSLELLMDKFHTRTGLEFILDEMLFKRFYEDMKNHARSWLKDKKVDKDRRVALYRSLLGINRRHYVEKAKHLLEYWGVSYSDADITLEEIVDVRNDITHRGVYYEKNDLSEDERVFKAYEGLFLILTRVFLAMLKYDDQYYDPVKQDWIKFSDVCNKIGKHSL